MDRSVVGTRNIKLNTQAVLHGIMPMVSWRMMGVIVLMTK